MIEFSRPLQIAIWSSPPRVLSVNTDYSRQYLSTRLGTLRDAKLVDRVDNELYQITDQGRAYLGGELDAETLEAEASD